MNRFLKVYRVSMNSVVCWINFDVFDKIQDCVIFRYNIPMLEDEHINKIELNLIMDVVRKYI